MRKWSINDIRHLVEVVNTSLFDKGQEIRLGKEYSYYTLDLARVNESGVQKRLVSGSKKDIYLWLDGFINAQALLI